MKDLFKGKFEAKKIDFNDPKVKKRIEACKKAQEECLKRKVIHPDVWKLTITI